MTTQEKTRIMQDAIDNDNMTLAAASAWCDAVELQGLSESDEDFTELRKFWYMGWYAAFEYRNKP